MPTETARPQARAGLVWRPAHRATLGGLDPHRQAEQTIGHQVEPQQLEREQGHCRIRVTGGQEVRDRPPEHHDDLPEVPGDCEPDEAAQVVVDDPALLDRGDDRREVVVAQHHVGRLLGDVRAGDAHRDTDVGTLQGRRVVHAVPGHRHDLALRLQRPDDPQLVLGRHPGEHVLVQDERVQRLVGEAIELGAAHRRLAVADTELASDRPCRQRVITGDHDRPDPCRPARRDRLPDLVARRVDDADQADQHEIVLDIHGRLDVAEHPIADAEDPHSVRRHGVVGRHDPVAPLVREPDLAVAVQQG